MNSLQGLWPLRSEAGRETDDMLVLSFVGQTRWVCFLCSMPDKCRVNSECRYLILQECLFPPQSVDAERWGSRGDRTSRLCRQPADVLLRKRGAPTTHSSACTHFCYMLYVSMSASFIRACSGFFITDTDLMLNCVNLMFKAEIPQIQH